MKVKPSLLFVHMQKVYDELHKQAVHGHFEGSKVEAFDATGINRNNYTPVYRCLEQLGCIKTIQRGNGRRPSILELDHPPKLEALANIYEKKLTPMPTVGKLTKDVEALQRRIPNIDLAHYLTSLDKRLTELEATVSQHESTLDFLTPREEE